MGEPMCACGSSSPIGSPRLSQQGNATGFGIPEIRVRSTREPLSAGESGANTASSVHRSVGEGSATEGDCPDLVDWKIPKQRGSMYYLCNQWVHRLQAT